LDQYDGDSTGHHSIKVGPPNTAYFMPAGSGNPPTAGTAVCVKPKPRVKTKGGSLFTKPHIQLTLYIYNPGKQKTVGDQIVTAGASVAQPLTKSKGESFPTK